jgi:hypothetical protein
MQVSRLAFWRFARVTVARRVTSTAGFFILVPHSLHDYYTHINRNGQRQKRLDLTIFVGIIISMKAGRPPKDPEDRRDRDMKIPLSENEREIIVKAAQADEGKPVTWARDVLLKAAKRRLTRG